MGRLGELFNEYQEASERVGDPTAKELHVQMPVFVLHLYGQPSLMWNDLWARYPEMQGRKVAGCVIGENPYHVFLCGLRKVGEKYTVNHLMLGHEILHLVKQVVADQENNRDTGASIILNPDDVAQL